ncbi:hypothetical protein GGX14DRAFT_309977, partial [Mycena pura]
IPISEAQLLTQLFEAIFFGLYTVSLGFCLQALLRAPNGWKKTSEISKTMLVVTLLMGFFATFDLCLTFIENINALALYHGPGGSAEAFQQTASWIDLMGNINVISQTKLGDGMLIYRCWIVHGKSWSVVAPSSALLTAGFVVSALKIYLKATLPYGSQFSPGYYRLVTTGWALTICINVLTTGLIVYRIWNANIRNRAIESFSNTTTSKPGKTAYQNAIRIIIDSGFLYTSVAVMSAAAYISRSNAFTPLSAIDIQVIGITFNLILIRVNKVRRLEN